MKKILLIVFSFVLSFSSISQVLNLPQRQTNALNGAQFVNLITSMNLTDRENEIFYQVMNGNVPEFLRTMKPITVTQTISSVSYTLTYYAIPDYLAVGCDSNYFLCPMTPLLAQKICDYTNCIMPTRKMVNAIWSTATVKLSPSTIPPSGQMTTVPVFDQHNTTVWGQRSAVIPAHPLGELVGGDKKDVVISNMIYGYPTPGRVVIYGWHYTSGSPIQPLYNGHEETYADYSHGIRLVQMSCVLNGNPTTINSILSSATLNPLLSDEGVIATPRYPVTLPLPVVPKSFCIVNNGSGSLKIKIKNYIENTGCIVTHSTDGINFFQLPVLYNDTNIVISGLSNEIIHYFKIAGVNNIDTSAFSEVLAAVPSGFNTKTIIVNGFDRATTGNTKNFVIQHGKAIYQSGYLFNSATNEALTDNLIALTDYSICDLILGEESTVDETFSNNEQVLFSAFLNLGGKLFVSGAEIAWDLDNKGSTSDKSFINNYLKVQYINDAPNGQSATYYGCSTVSSQFFSSIFPFQFDNGTHGTYNVKYPDVVNGVNGGINAFLYSGLNSNYAGAIFSGMFPSGSQAGKVVFLGLPFETIYPDSSRNKIMSKVLEYFDPLVPLSVFTSSTSQLCQNDSVTLSTISDFGYHCQWLRNGIMLAGDTLNTITVYQSGNYQVQLSHNNQQVLSNLVNIVFTPLPVVQITSLNSLSICEGDSAVLSTLTDNSYSWQWYNDNVIITGADSSEISVSESGLYEVIVSVNGCSSSDSLEVLFYPLPTEPSIIETGGILSTDTAYTYQWYDINGPISGANQQLFQPLQNGIYYVSISNLYGCVAFSEQFNYIITTVNEIEHNNIIYSNGNVIVNSTTACYYNFIDGSGRVINSGKLSKGQNKISINLALKGLFFLQLISEDGGRIESFKIAI